MYGALVSVTVVTLQTILTPDKFAFETKLPSIYFLLDIFGSKQNTAFFLVPPDFDWSYCLCGFNRLFMERQIGNPDCVYKIIHSGFCSIRRIMNRIFYLIKHTGNLACTKFAVRAITQKPAVTAPACRYSKFFPACDPFICNSLAQYRFQPKLLQQHNQTAYKNTPRSSNAQNPPPSL